MFSPMFDEQLEFAISQYADGSLPPGRRAAIESQIAADPALAALLEEYRQLGACLQMTTALPAINWDRLATHLSEQIDASAEPVQIYAMPWVRRAAGLAVAACLAVVIGISFDKHAKPSAAPNSVTVAGQIAVAGPVADAPTGAVVSEISVGPSPAVAMDDASWRYGDSGIVSQPARVVIASSDAPVQDTSATPY